MRCSHERPAASGAGSCLIKLNLKLAASLGGRGVRFPRGWGRGISRARCSAPWRCEAAGVWRGSCGALCCGGIPAPPRCRAERRKRQKGKKKKKRQNRARPRLPQGQAVLWPQPRSPVCQAAKAALSHRYVCLQGFFQLHLCWNSFSVNAEGKFSPGISRRGCVNLSRAIPAIAGRELGM